MIHSLYAGIHEKIGEDEYKIQSSRNTGATLRVPIVSTLKTTFEQRNGGIENHLIYCKSMRLPFLDIGYVLIADELSATLPEFSRTDFFVSTVPNDSGRNRISMSKGVLEKAQLNAGDEIIYLGIGNYIVLGKKQDLEHLQKIGTGII